MKNKTYLISLLMTQHHFEMTWLNNTVRLAAVSWECHIQEVASEHLLLPCYITRLDEQDPKENNNIKLFLNPFNPRVKDGN